MRELEPPLLPLNPFDTSTSLSIPPLLPPPVLYTVLVIATEKMTWTKIESELVLLPAQDQGQEGQGVGKLVVC